MEKTYFIKYMVEFANDVTFSYNNKKCGVCSEVKNSIFSFQAWCGKKVKEYGQTSIETVMQDKFFYGKSIEELLDTVEFWFI